MAIEFKVDVYLHHENEHEVQDALARIASLIAASTSQLAALTRAVKAIEPDRQAIAGATSELDQVTSALEAATAGAGPPPA